MLQLHLFNTTKLLLSKQHTSLIDTRFVNYINQFNQKYYKGSYINVDDDNNFELKKYFSFIKSFISAQINNHRKQHHNLWLSKLFQHQNRDLFTKVIGQYWYQADRRHPLKNQQRVCNFCIGRCWSYQKSNNFLHLARYRRFPRSMNTSGLQLYCIDVLPILLSQEW